MERTSSAIRIPDGALLVSNSTLSHDGSEPELTFHRETRPDIYICLSLSKLYYAIGGGHRRSVGMKVLA